jgi:predicted homoserine dehydrogenase-like protein
LRRRRQRLVKEDEGVKNIMTTEKIRVGIIGASMRNGWGRDAHIPALSALPEFEITAVSTSRQETADEAAKHFGITHAFADPYKWSSIQTWTSSRSACGCLFTINWGWLL